MRLFFRTAFFIVVLFTAAIPAAAQSRPALETLEPSSALAQIEASSGVVFVDLYAEW